MKKRRLLTGRHKNGTIDVDTIHLKKTNKSRRMLPSFLKEHPNFSRMGFAVGIFLIVATIYWTSDADRAALSWSNLSYEDFYERYAKPLLRVRTPGSESSKKVVQFIKTSLASSGLVVSNHTFSDKGPNGRMYDFENVWAETSPEMPNKVVFSCHHDSKILTFRSGKIPFVGAIDSAVPCAILLYLASLFEPENSSQCSLRWSSKRQNVSLIFMFFDGEEAIVDWTATDSLYGSRYFVENIEREITGFLSQIKLFLLLDLIGTKDMKFQMFAGSKGNRCYNELQKIETGFKKEEFKSCNSRFEYDSSYMSNYFSNGVVAGRVEDDQVPFLERNVPVLHLIPVPFPSVWHKESDNEDSLHHPTIQNLVQVLTAFLFDLSCIN